MNTKIEFSAKTIFIAVVVIVAGWLFYLIRDVLYLLFIAFLLMTAIHPLVLFFERLKIPRFISVLVIYAVFFGMFGWLLASSIPTIVVQTTRLSQEFPEVVVKVLPYWKADFSTVTQQIAPIGENLIKVTVNIFSNIVTILTVLMFTFYFLLERRHTKKVITDIFGESIADRTAEIFSSVEERLGAWVRGEMILMLTIGILSYIGLLALRIDYALPLAIVAGVLEIVPNIGPIVSAIPAILIALVISPVMALCVAGLYIVIQQFENNVIVPVVMRHSVGFSPLITVLALMVGGRLAGVLGAILAIPVLLVCQVLITKLLIEPATKRAARQSKNPLKD